MSEGNIMQTLLYVWIVSNIISLIFYVLQSWGLYLINKKLWEEYAWLSWIPVVQVYSFVKAAWRPTIWILWLILWLIFFVIPWLIIAIILLNDISKRTGNGTWTTILLVFFPFIMFPYIWNKMSANPIKNPQNLNSSETINL